MCCGIWSVLSRSFPCYSCPTSTLRPVRVLDINTLIIAPFLLYTPLNDVIITYTARGPKKDHTDTFNTHAKCIRHSIQFIDAIFKIDSSHLITTTNPSSSFQQTTITMTTTIDSTISPFEYVRWYVCIMEPPRK
jgi:hypothetical protein